MNLHPIAAERLTTQQTSRAASSGGQSFQLAYAKVCDMLYAPGAADAAPDRTPYAQQDPMPGANTAHTVHKGETLSGIVRARLATMGAAADAGALREGVARLANANNIPNPDRIYVGQKLDLAALDAVFGRNLAAAPRALVPAALRDTVSPPGDREDFATDFNMFSRAQWRPEDIIAAETLPMSVMQAAQLPVATLPSPPADAIAGIDSAATAPMPPIDPNAARQVALYEQNSTGALPDILYKGFAGKVLDAMPIEPSTRVALQRANTVVSSAFTARALGALTGLGGPLLTIAGLAWGIFSARHIEAAPAADATPVADANSAFDAKHTAQNRVADAHN